MNHQNKTINIFCIIANIGSDQDLYIESILNDKIFCNSNRLSRLTYNTTKPANNIEDRMFVDKYKYFTIEDYKNLPSSDILEYRSYYTIPYHDVYYFTLKEDITKKRKNYNLICIASPFQYESYRTWVSLENMKEPNKYSLHAIFIHCNSKNRMTKMIKNTTDSCNDITIMEICRRFLQDNAEFNDTKNRIPELDDPLSCNNTCYIDNDDFAEYSNSVNISKIKSYIANKVKND